MNLNHLLQELRIHLFLEMSKMRQYTEETPKWEKISGLVCLLILVFYSITELHKTTESFSIHHLLFFLGLSFTTYLLYCKTKREIRIFKAYYLQSLKTDITYSKLAYKAGSLTKSQYIIKRFIFASAFVAKVMKPAIATCSICIGGGASVNYLYSEIFGVSPLSEMGYVFSKKQTTKQALHHIFNPNEYQNSLEKPYIQDIKNELLRRDNELRIKDTKIKELENLLNSTTKK